MNFEGPRYRHREYLQYLNNGLIQLAKELKELNLLELKVVHAVVPEALCARVKNGKHSSKLEYGSGRPAYTAFCHLGYYTIGVGRIEQEKKDRFTLSVAWVFAKLIDIWKGDKFALDVVMELDTREDKLKQQKEEKEKNPLRKEKNFRLWCAKAFLKMIVMHYARYPHAEIARLVRPIELIAMGKWYGVKLVPDLLSSHHIFGYPLRWLLVQMVKLGYYEKGMGLTLDEFFTLLREVNVDLAQDVELAYVFHDIFGKVNPELRGEAFIEALAATRLSVEISDSKEILEEIERQLNALLNVTENERVSHLNIFAVRYALSEPDKEKLRNCLWRQESSTPANVSL